MLNLQLNGKLDNDGGEACQVSFKYRQVGTTGWTYTSWEGSYTTGQTFSKTISVEEDKAHEVVARAQNSIGIAEGSSKYAIPGVIPGYEIALLGDSSNHGGSVVSHNQDGKFKVNGVEVAVQGAQHSCPLPGHGTTSITANTVKSYCNGRLILTRGATAGCGALLTPVDRRVYVEGT